MVEEGQEVTCRTSGVEVRVCVVRGCLLRVTRHSSKATGASSFHDDSHGGGGGGGYLHEDDRRGGVASGAEDASFSQQQKSTASMQSFGSFASRNKHGSSQYR